MLRPGYARRIHVALGVGLHHAISSVAARKIHPIGELFSIEPLVEQLQK